MGRNQQRYASVQGGLYPRSPSALASEKVQNLIRNDAHPVPNVYFIRRSPSHLKQYLNYDPSQIEQIYNRQGVTQVMKQNYEHFKIDEQDRKNYE